MAKKPEFYERYLIAVFRRGRAKEIPMSYINKQAGSVLKKDEMEAMEDALKRLVESNVVVQTETGYSLQKDNAEKAVQALKKARK